MFGRLTVLVGFALAAAPTVAQEFQMTLAATAPAMENNFSYTNLEIFANEVEARSGGRIDVTFLSGGQLGGIESTINQTRDGVIQAADPADGHLAPLFPEIQVFSIPYVFVGREVAWDVLDGPFGERVADLMAERTGLRPLVWFENGGYRHYTSANRELRSLEDLAGLKMRTMNHPMHMEVAESLGMSPTPIPWGELYTALQTGVVEGQENAIPTFLVPNLHEVQSHMILDGHVYAVSTVIVNEGWFQGLPDDLQAVVRQAAHVALWTNRGLSVSNEVAGRRFLEAEGMTIHEPTPAERVRFRDVAQPAALEWLRGEIDPGLIDDMLSAVAEADERFGHR